jgi:pyruvate/2-oxoglutarate dehydrogenase complex dihydrolipoamide dehydrogenase (E3) component
VALIERDRIGGECTHSGCIPSKTLVSAAKTFHEWRRTEAQSLPPVAPTADFSFGRVMAHVDSVVQSVYQHETPEVYRDMGIDVYIHPSGAQFLDSRRIRIGDDVIEAAYTVISSVSSPKRPRIVGHEPFSYLTNENFWAMRAYP